MRDEKGGDMTQEPEMIKAFLGYMEAWDSFASLADALGAGVHRFQKAIRTSDRRRLQNDCTRTNRKNY